MCGSTCWLLDLWPLTVPVAKQLVEDGALLDAGDTTGNIALHYLLAVDELKDMHAMSVVPVLLHCCW